MSLENPTFDDLPDGHPIKKFCDDWKIDDWPTRTALMELIVGCVIKATQALVEDPEQVCADHSGHDIERDDTPEAC